MPVATERRLVAIFAADVEGYSRLMGADEVGTLRDLMERRAILDGLIASHRGPHRTKRTWRDVGLESVMRLGADITIASLRMTVIRARCVCDATNAINRPAKGRRSHRIYSNP